MDVSGQDGTWTSDLWIFSPASLLINRPGFAIIFSPCRKDQPQLTSHLILKPRVEPKPLPADCGGAEEKGNCCWHIVFQSHRPCWTAHKRCWIEDNRHKTGYTRCVPSCSVEKVYVLLVDTIHWGFEMKMTQTPFLSAHFWGQNVKSMSFKVAQSSFQHFPRHRFWCVINTTIVVSKNCLIIG